jgi:hypothetical protein
MKEAGDAPGLAFGDPSTDQDWIRSSTVRRATATLVSGSRASVLIESEPKL